MPKSTPKKITTDEIFEFFGGDEGAWGGITKLAKLLDCTPQAISMWRGFVPRSRVFEVAHHSKGKWTVDQLPTREPIGSVTSAA